MARKIIGVAENGILNEDNNVAVDVNQNRMSNDDENSGIAVDFQSWCSLSLGSADANVLYVSSFFAGNQTIFEKLPKVVKEIVDYCFLDHATMDNEEMLVEYTPNFFLLRKHVLSILKMDIVSPNVVNCMVILLNSVMSLQLPDSYFFGLSHMDLLLQAVAGDTGSKLSKDILSYWSKWLDDNICFAKIPATKMKVETFDNFTAEEWNESVLPLITFGVHARHFFCAELCSYLVLVDLNDKMPYVLKSLQDFNDCKDWISKMKK